VARHSGRSRLFPSKSCKSERNQSHWSKPMVTLEERSRSGPQVSSVVGTNDLANIAGTVCRSIMPLRRVVSSSCWMATLFVGKSHKMSVHAAAAFPGKSHSDP
jgi:hypothetical protein